MKSKTVLVSGLAIVLGLAVAGWMLFKPSARQETARAKTDRPLALKPPNHPTPSAATPAPTADLSSAAPAGNISERAPRSQPLAKSDAPQKVVPPTIPTKKPKPPLQDPLARVAMSLVGADPDAEAYWLEAIYDSSLPDKEREDLMEDLNEEGLSDHKRPGPEDFPLIMNRIAIIEQIVPSADEFMLPHLREAYKDLLNLAEITRGGGEPVR